MGTLLLRALWWLPSVRACTKSSLQFWNRRADLRNSELGSDFCDHLCYFLHPEGLDEFIWRWIVLEAESLKATRITEHEPLWGDRIRWSHRLLGGLVKAHSTWSEDGTANSAIRQFEAAVRIFGYNGRLSKTVALIGGGVVITRVLTNDYCQPCDPTLFDWFVRHGVPESCTAKWSERNSRA